MTNESLAFSFIDVPLRPGKPRSLGKTIIRDRMRGMGEQEEFLRTYADFVDFAKLSNMAPRLYRESFVKAKLALYMRHDVTPFFGGILFENATVQGKTERLFTYLAEIGAPALEISDNIIAIDDDELCRQVESAKKHGLRVFVEWGEKYPNKLFDLEQAKREISARLDAGVDFVIVERSELDQVFDADDPSQGVGQLKALAEAVGPENLIFETETRAQMVGMLDAMGRDVNLGPNIDFEEVKWLEPSRLGISREMGHTTIEKVIGTDKVRSRRS